MKITVLSWFVFWTALPVVTVALPARAAESPQRRQFGPAELVLLNGKIWTGAARQGEAEALAIWHERILAVGTNAAIESLIGPGTHIRNLQGRRVLPGFHDSHVHLLNAGLQLSRVTLRDAREEKEFGRRLQAFDRQAPPGRWLLGGDWDHDRTFAGQLPSAELLDRYVPDRPVFLRRYDGHMAVVNSHVLRLANISAQTPDPAGGVIYRKPSSKEPTGLLRDKAMGLVSKFVPALTDREITEAVQAALVEAHRAGVTSVQDMDGSSRATRQQLFRLYRNLARSRRLGLRVLLYWPLAEWQSLAEIGLTRSFGDDWVKIGGLKGFADGSLGSSTARMFEPYLNEPGNTGIFVNSLDSMAKDILAADRAGLPVAVHAIGDRANAELLDLFAEVSRQNGPGDRRCRIEHAQHLRPQDYRRFRELGVIASMQPYHAIDDGRWAEGRIGARRCASSYAFRSLLNAGARLAFGSDWPVAPLSPLLGIDAAVNRRVLDGKYPQGWFAEQGIPVAQAIEAYTLGAAHASFAEKEIGSLEAGKLADLVVLSRDILAATECDHISTTRVVLTMVGGHIVHETRDQDTGK
jgi:predicted amidohydrolase YtcJ